MFKKWIRHTALGLALSLGLVPGLFADEMAIRVTPFTPAEFDAVEMEETVTVFEDLNRAAQYTNLLDLKDLRFNKYGLILKFERQGVLTDSKGAFAYNGFFRETFDTENRQGGLTKFTISRQKYVLFDDVVGITCGKLQKHYGKKVRGKGLVARPAAEAGEAITVLQLKKGEAVYFESTAAQAIKLAANLKLLTKKTINNPKNLGLGIEVSPDTGRVITAIDGTLLGKVPLFSALTKIDGKKIKSPEAAKAAKLAKNGAILTFMSENIKHLDSKKKKIEIRVKREGK